MLRSRRSHRFCLEFSPKGALCLAQIVDFSAKRRCIMMNDSWSEHSMNVIVNHERFSQTHWVDPRLRILVGHKRFERKKQRTPLMTRRLGKPWSKAQERYEDEPPGQA